MQADSKFNGTVLDADGKPVADAEVWLIPTDISKESSDVPESRKGDPTDQSGNFSMLLDENQSWGGMVYKKGFAPALTNLTSRNIFPGHISRPGKHRLELKPSKTFSVKVVDSNRKPVEIKSARVSWFSDGNEFFQFVKGARLPYAVEVKKNEVTMDWVPQLGHMSLEIETESTKQEVGFPFKETAIEVELAPTTKLAGVVKLKSGEDAPNGFFEDLRVKSYIDGRPDQKDAEHPKYGLTQTATFPINPDGTFEVNCITGSGSLSLSKGSLSIASTKIVAGQRKDSAIELIFTPPRIAKGKVVDSEGSPIAGVKINNTVSNMGGEFEFEFYESNANWQISSVPEGYLRPMNMHGNRIDLRNAKPGDPINLPDTVLKLATPIAGKVVNENGQPVKDAKVVARWVFCEGQFSTLRTDAANSDAEGNFTLKSTEADVEIGITARTNEEATLAPLTESFKQDSKPIELVVSAKALVNGTIKVRDSEGNPIKGAKVQLMSKTKSPGGHTYGSRRLFGNECLTNSKGVFEFPEKVIRSGELSMNVAAEGYVTAERASIKIPSEGDLKISDVVLRSTRTIAGTVVDSQGNPVANATVWSHGIEDSNGYSGTQIRPEGSLATTDESGTFKLTNIHSDATFVFARKPGSIHTGSLIPRDKETELVLRSESEKIESPVAIKWKPSPESIKALEEHITFVRKVTKASNYKTNKIIDALRRVGSSKQQDLVASLKGGEKARLLASLGHIEDAIEVCQALKSPSSRVRAYQICADSTEQKAHKILFLEEAAFEIGNILQTPSRLEQSSSIIDELINLGEVETATELVKSIMPSALELNIEGRNEYSKAWFAKAAVRVDYENSWKLIEESRTSKNETSGGFGRHAGNMAHELAATDPDKAIELLRKMDSEFSKHRYAPRVAYRAAQNDVKKGIEILEEFMPANSDNRNRSDRTSFVSGYSAMATIVTSADPKKGRELIDKATESFEVARSNQFAFGAALNLLVHASECGPVAAENAYWKLLDQYSNPNIKSWDVEGTAKVKLRQSAELAVLLGLTDRFPEVRQQAVGQIYEAFKGEGKLEGMLGRSLTDLSSCFAAVAMDDPQRAVEWHKKLYGRIHEDARNYIPMPWVVIANTLSMDGKEFSRYIANETMHQWVPGAED